MKTLYIHKSYRSSDIKLDMEIKDHQLILKYYGKNNEEVNNIEKEFRMGFILEADITKK